MIALRKYRYFSIIALVLFGMGIVLGLVTPQGLGGLPAEQISALEELARLLAGLPRLAVFFVILFKNITALFASFVLSPLLLAMPVFSLVLNGWVVGIVSETVVAERSLQYLLAGLLPHGIIEVPAIIFGDAVALSFGISVILAIFSAQRRQTLQASIIQDMKALAVAIAFLVPAAAIETYLTPLLLP